MANLIQNPGFEFGQDDWFFYTNGVADFTIKPFNNGTNTAEIAIVTPGTNTQLNQNGLAVVTGKVYKLSFRAMVNISGRPVNVVLQQHEIPNTWYGLDAVFNLTSAWATYSKEFTAPSGTENLDPITLLGRLRFSFVDNSMQSGDKFYIDDVILEEVNAVTTSTLKVFRSGNGSVSINGTILSPSTGDYMIFTYSSGTIVNLTAIPAQGYSVVWSGDINGTELVKSFTVTNTDSIITATFVQNANVIISIEGVGTGTGKIKVAGVEYSLTKSFQFPYGTVFNVEAIPGAGSKFASWSRTGETPFSTNSNISLTLTTSDEILCTFDIQSPDTGITIITQPIDATKYETYPAEFSVVATSTSALSYQWQQVINRVGTNIVGATNSTYIMQSVKLNDSGKQFHCVIYNTAGTTEVTSMVTLTVVPSGKGITITTQPIDATKYENSSAEFSVVATSSSPLLYQWMQEVVNQNGITIVGAMSPKYTIPSVKLSDNNKRFYCVISNDEGTTESTRLATLTVVSGGMLINITIQPVSQTVIEGKSATFSVIATSNSPSQLRYQWQQVINQNGTNITGATSSTYITPKTIVADNGKRLHCIISTEEGDIKSTNVVTLNVTTVPVIFVTLKISTAGTGTEGQFAVNTDAPTVYYEKKFPINTVVSLQSVTTSNKSKFIKWSGDLNSTQPLVNVTLTKASTVIYCNFSTMTNIYAVLTITGPTGIRDRGKVKINRMLEILPSIQNFVAGTMLTLTAIPNASYFFNNWTVDNVQITDNPYSFRISFDTIIFCNISSTPSSGGPYSFIEEEVFPYSWIPPANIRIGYINAIDQFTGKVKVGYFKQ